MVASKQWFTSERHVLVQNVDLRVLEIHKSWQSTLVFSARLWHFRRVVTQTLYLLVIVIF